MKIEQIFVPDCAGNGGNGFTYYGRLSKALAKAERLRAKKEKRLPRLLRRYGRAMERYRKELRELDDLDVFIVSGYESKANDTCQ